MDGLIPCLFQKMGCNTDCRPAPEYYLTPKSGYMILRQMRRRRRSEKMKQLLVHVKRLQNNLED